MYPLLWVQGTHQFLVGGGLVQKTSPSLWTDLLNGVSEDTIKEVEDVQRGVSELFYRVFGVWGLEFHRKRPDPLLGLV